MDNWARENQASLSVDGILQGFKRRGIILGLERIQHLLAALGNPHNKVPILHVAGTNGKGSVCAYLSTVLLEAGYRVGRYTSPHLVSWTERIWLNGNPIPETDLLELLQHIQATIDPGFESPTQFEVITAAACLYFAQQAVDIAVMEVGLGGRLDATNVWEQPLVSIITSISRDHWQILGDGLGNIAAEKAGILKAGCPAVIGPLPPIAETAILNRLQHLHCPAVHPEPAQEVGPDQVHFTGACRLPSAYALTPLTYSLSLPGAVQLANSALAIATLQILQHQGWQIPEAAIVTGLAKTDWPGRLQWTTWQGHRLLVDGAHNIGGITALRQYVDRLPASQNVSPLANQGIHWIMGIMANKDHPTMLSALLKPGDFLYLVPIPDAFSADPAKLATLAEEICPDLQHCQSYADLESALAAAFAQEPSAGQLSPSKTNLRVLCGSLYLVGHFLAGGRS